jgi:ubiquitin C-terminal hydrolase
MDLEKYKNKGLSGLANLGNTCYINSCIQVLSHTYELNNLLDLKTYKTKLNNICDSVLLVEWDNLRQLLWSQNCIVAPSKFIKTLQKVATIKEEDKFTGYEQNDVSEFLIFIVDTFHTALSREVNMTIQGNIQNNKDELAVKCYERIRSMYSKEYSEIWNIFYGVHVSNIVSESSTILSRTPEPFFMLNLSIPMDKKNIGLLDCLNLYVEGEKVENYLNETTGNRETVEKQILFWSFPNILVIDLKRFNSSNRKNQSLIEFPVENLNLSPYVIGYNKDSYVYDLYAVCNHSGNVHGGHYSSFIKNANGKWYHFNDTIVVEILESNIITPKAYCLFYRKKTIL